MSNYHNRIMNIQATRVKEFRPQHISYKEGHRDARHAAAEIALEAEREIEELKETLCYVEDRLRDMELDTLADFILRTLRKE